MMRMRGSMSGSRKHEIGRKRETRKGRKPSVATGAAVGGGSPDSGLPGPGSPRPASSDDAWDRAFDAEFARDSAELERSGRTLTRVLFFVFLGVALLLLTIAALTGISTARKLAREVSALAQVTALTERKDAQGNSFFYPVVSFEIPGAGSDGGSPAIGRQNVQLAEGSWPPAHRVGELVTVLYDSLNPLDARIASGGGTAALWTWTLVTGLVGAAFLGATVLAWALGQRSA